MSTQDATLTWLGQSGFLLEAGGLTFACDLYLSDYCQKRSKLDHTRLAPIPVKPEELEGVDHYLITHGHIDHFDPETVGPVMEANPQTKFYCPPVCRNIINEFFPGKACRFEIVSSLKETPIAPDVRLVAIPAAHEDLEKDADGEYIAYSYLLIIDGIKKAVFFAGDTIPYDGQGKMIRENMPQDYELTMVLPVNGRDIERATLGFKGNLNLDEATALAKECGAKLLVPCHFGMFALNDIKEEFSADGIKERGCNAVIPRINSPIGF
ncbi:MAG: MBL fold metallo-hydrolase [Planctomycetes bacterium]|nr:MBL fold metallo-hydrolase [Planctomycetota bacterium]